MSRRAATKRKYVEIDSDNDSPHENEDEEEVEEMVQKKSKKSDLGDWVREDGVLILKHKKFSAKPTGNKILAFDLDSTITETISGATFAKNATDWKFWDESIPEKMKESAKEGFILVIFTNQGGITKKKTTVAHVIGRIENVISATVGDDIPFLAFAAPQDDHYRKPSTGMWDRMVKDFFENDPSRIDINESIYVGDAAGRLAEWKKGKKKDFSCSDRKYALNIGLKFLTPEQFFLGENETKKWKFDVIEPKVLFKDVKEPYKTADLISDKQELVLFTGWPASGKSTFYRKHFEPNDYVHVNRDTLKTPAKCKSTTVSALKSGKSVVIDNTNGKASDRKEYLKLAENAGVEKRCFVFDTPRNVAEHLNLLREKVTKGDSKHVPGVAYNIYNKNRDDVDEDEGWDEIKTIEFIPTFSDDNEKKVFYQYT
ncbi:bifunctional polynucleotide phosphatase/kinase [Acrasis kona]|uniref:Bifunctional polynucleotide phosphatase/kinase n=1 Tax=Acrasis kona TaxID=1008807 RepID=A0AAW2Z2N6_9EUKA